MTITKKEYQDAQEQVTKSEKVIRQYHSERQEKFDTRLKNGTVFTDDELVYSAYNLCPCGHGLAYPNDCGPGHYWDCSAILKGTHDKNQEHCAQLPFTTTKMKSENNIFPRGIKPTTRGVFKLKEDE